MTSPISESTLQRFREAAAGGQASPAGVAVAAVSASFAFGLVAKALTVSARRDSHHADLAKLEPLAAALRLESSRMLELAERDTAAFEHYLACVRSPRATDEERSERRHALDAALHHAIDVPLAAARATASGIAACAQALPMTDLAVLADLAAAASLLSGALRAFLVCAQSNVSVLGAHDASLQVPLAQEAGRHRHALQLAQQVMEQVAQALEPAHPGRAD